MKKLIFFCIVLMVMTMQVYAQQGVGINLTGNAPDSSAILDVSATNRGFLLPRFNLSTASFTPARPQSYLMVFDTVGTINAGSRFNTGRGLYFNAGTPAAPSWRRFLTSVDSTLFWGLRGNTIAVGDFLGTNNDQDLIIKAGSVATYGAPLTTKLTIPDDPTEQIVVSNVDAFRVPIGSPTTPTFRFVSTTLGLAGLTGSGNSGVVIRSATNMYTYFSQNGIRLTTSSASGNWLPESSALDILGNIYTRNKIVYSEFGAVPTTATPDKTFKNEFHWDGTIAAGADSPDLFNENNTIKFVIRRNGANEYFIQIAASTGRTFTCANNLNEIALATTTVIGTYWPVNFATEVTGPNATQTVIVREQIASAPTYRLTIMVANHNVSVVIERWQN